MLSGWKQCQLGDVLTLQRGFDITKKEQRQGSVPVISSSGINSFHDTAKVNGPGVIIGRKGSLGTVFYIGEDYWPHDTTLWVKDFHSNFPKFTYYFLITLNLAHFDAGASNPTLNRNHVHLLPVCWPSLPTQHKIAAILSAYDDLIENNTRRIAILEEMAQSLYREWFVHFRFPGHEKKRLVESALGLIPEGWEVFALRDISIYINRGISPKYDDTSANIVINQRCIRNDKLNLEAARKHLTKVSNEKLVRYGDVLVNSTGIGTLGRVAQVYQHIPNCTVDSHVSIVRPGDKVTIDYFGFYLLGLQSHFDSLGVGSTGQTELGRESIGQTRFLLPPKELQEAFAKLVSPMRKSISLMATKNANLRQTRDLLLPKLISGEVDVEGLDIQVEGGTYESGREPIPSIS